MKKILGLDLGVASIGWAVITEHENEHEILGMGSRIVPYSSTEDDDFTKGTGESKNAQRTQYRTARKGLDRYGLRRKALKAELVKYNMLPDLDLMNLSAIKLYGLRDTALTHKLSLQEIGRILLHLNQRRGYKHGTKEEITDDKKQRDYVAGVFGRWEKINQHNWTVGQYFYNGLIMDVNSEQWKNLCSEFNCNERLGFRIKEQVFPRQAYEEEFEKIWNVQQKEYPDILTNQFKQKIFNEIIYYQRQLKSQKDLVNICEFEGEWRKDKKGKDIFCGPRVAARSNPLFQLCKIWESINNIEVKRINFKFDITPYKQKIFEYLDNNENLSEIKLFEILGINKTDGYYTNVSIKNKGIQGNLTKTAFLKVFSSIENFDELVRFNLEEEKKELVNKSTGELIVVNQISDKIENEPLYKLWHVCYSIKDRQVCKNVLISKFSLPEEVVCKLSKIDFSKGAFSNKSVKAMRKILSYLMQDYKYSEAMECAGYNHSNSLTRDENLRRELKEKLSLLRKNELRQPIVEKILNQMIHVVNAVIEKYGNPDEIRVELARELKQSKDERNDFFKTISQRNRESDKIVEKLEKEFGVKGTRKNIEKWRLWHEVKGRCLYCDKQISVAQFIKGIESDVEHIIPRSIFYDDSYANKTISHTACNHAKSDNTAFDFMHTKSKTELETYLMTIKDLYDNKSNKVEEGAQCLVGKISKRKYERLQWTVDDIPQDFISRQLRETSFISKKACEILSQICHQVNATSGNVTEKLRKLWGWEDALMNLQLKKFKEAGLYDLIGTEQWESDNGRSKHQKEVIKDWSKRDDHRHHAIDALAIACTRQGYIQRMNTLNAEHTRKEMLAEIKGQEYSERLNLLDKYLIKQKPFSTGQVEEAASKILISFKSGKKVATNSKYKAKGKNKETGIIVPRGALSQESVYGKITYIETENGIPVQFRPKYLFDNPHLIFKSYIKTLVEERLVKFENNINNALASLKKDPIYLDKNKTVMLEFATCFKEEYVLKYTLGAGQGMLFDGKEDDKKAKKVLISIVDKAIREKIESRIFINGIFVKTKEAFKDLDTKPVWFNEEKRIPVKSVRCFTGLSEVEPVKKDHTGKNIGFVKPANNHHIAIYIDEKGKKQEHVCTFWHAVERKKYGIPVVIEHPEDVWNKILQNPEAFPESFIKKLPDDRWQFDLSMQQNEMFLLGLNNEDADKAIAESNNKLISEHLYRVQKIAKKNYVFRHQLETQIIDSKDATLCKRFYLLQSINGLFVNNPIKVKINKLGEITDANVRK
ncbi:MAG: type II CRISPR RNA-guided endonuclease Cas9 [Bacteroidia bacterium]|nr:type II CRISPR RNA-guided endonuclease Cas9 [Bacteroidia bacterium]